MTPQDMARHPMHGFSIRVRPQGNAMSILLERFPIPLQTGSALG
jgi:hypothetical protein